MFNKIIFIFFISTFASCSINESEKKVLEVKQIFIDAAKGDPDAQFKLGFKYYYGDQVNQNRDSSKYWLNKAAENGHVNAKKTYDAFFEIIPDIDKNDAIK